MEVRPRDGDAVALGSCPPWCTTQDRHFDDGEMFPDSPVTVVKGVPQVLDASARCRSLGTAEFNTDMCAEMTPGQARAVAAALLDVAATAERAGRE